MALDKLSFTKDWTNSNDFPTMETDEAAVRRDMQLLHDETKSYINEKVAPAVDAVREELDAAVKVQNQTKHTHSNKALLDTYAQTEENIADAVAKKHSHHNKAVLDGIAAVTQELGDATDKVPSESAVSAAIAAAGNLPAGGVAGQALVKKSNESYDTQWDTLTAARVGAYSKDEVDAFLSEKPNPNLLDNWYFGNPVNQRGQTSYTDGGYGIDRWKSLGASVVTINDGSVTFTSGATIATGCHMAQYLENYSDLSGITVTLSVLVKDISGKFEFFIGGNHTGSIQEPGLYFWTTQKDTSEIAVKFYNGNEGSAFIELAAIKLELGTTQTLAHQENGVWVLNEIPDYGEQLARCQRYFQTFATESLRHTDALDFRPVMRTTPALSTITVGGKTLYTASADL